MARKKTYYPGVNQRLYALSDFMGTYGKRMRETGVLTDPELAAVNTLETAIDTATTALPRYKEQR